MELKAFIHKVETETIYELEKKLGQARDRLAFLVDYANFSPAEMCLNTNTFMWHDRMPAIFEEHKLIVSEKRHQYEKALKVCDSYALSVTHLLYFLLISAFLRCITKIIISRHYN